MAGQPIKIATFDTNADLMNAIKNGEVAFAVDQQPWLQGYQAVDKNVQLLGQPQCPRGRQPILTGSSFIDKTNIDRISSYATEGVR